jgi:sterol desaturase/sphingolipid hydroxylase (fatty acid hydroxylase superfamily)
MNTGSNKKTLWQALISTETDVGERYRPVATAVLVTFAIVYALMFPGFMQYVAYLGPGLGDDWNYGPFLQLLQNTWATTGGEWSNPLLLGLAALVMTNMIFTAAIIILSYTLYPKTVGKPFPVAVLFTYLSLSVVCTTGIGFIHLLLGVGALVLGYDFMSGLTAVQNLLNQLRALAQQVPTIIDMPAWLAFIVLNMVGGFFHYWFHRLSHESRVLWLLFHRTHHMTPELIQASAQAVFNSFPFFIFAAVPYVVIFSVVGKLVTSESLITYLIVFKLFSAFANMWSHQTALYTWAQGQWWIRVLSTITSEGVYHYLHHSAEDQHHTRHSNIVNVGGGLFFFWDRVFGTYRTVTPQRPRVGLQGIAAKDMTTNPLRLAIAGIAQLVYELRYNPGVMEWAKILFGGSEYVPAKTKDYVLREGIL